MLSALAIRRIGVLVLTTGLSLCVAGSAVAGAGSPLADEEQEGARIAASVRAGEKRCADLSADELESVGEYAMGSYLGGEATHSAMNRRMSLMMGETGERRMHIALGHRYSGCAGGLGSGWVGPMAGMMGGADYEDRGNHLGSMMGSGRNGGSGVSTLGGVLIALASAAIGAGMAALFMRRRQSGTGAAP